VQIYKLCKSSTGYVWNFIVYTGKDTIYGQTHPGEQTSSTIVLEVAHDLLDKGYCLYLDNWYTSPKLVDTLCTRKKEVGTMRTNRKEFPDFLKPHCLHPFSCFTETRKKGRKIPRAGYTSSPEETQLRG
jgi:hypothetical protein